MSSFLSNSASVVPHRRRLALQPQLFPVGPQPSEPNMHGPKQVADRGPAPIAVGPGVNASQLNAHAGATGCPPPCSGAAPAEPAAVARCGEDEKAHHHGVQVRDADAPLVGIARLAASSPSAESARKSEQRPEYFFLPVRSILNKCDSNRVPFEWTINPYRGCEFACKYCYARYTHEYMELDGSEFERKIFVKQNPAALLARDVERKYSYQRAGSDDGRPEHIAIGTATDPYQPAEKEYKVTRACLEELAKREGLSISVITKSNQVVRDIDVFQKNAVGSIAGAAGAPAGSADRRDSTVEGGRVARWSFGFAPDSGNHRSRRRFGGGRRGGKRGRGGMVFLRRAVSDAVFGEAIFAVHSREVSEARATVRTVLFEECVSARGIPAKDCRTRGKDSREARIPHAPIRRTTAPRPKPATEPRLEHCRLACG
jgi:hypothetical protein